MSAAVEEELAIAMNVALIEDNDERWSLNEFLWKRRDPRHACWKTVSFRIVFAEISAALLVKGIGPRLQRYLAKVGEAEAGIPHAGKIDFAFRRTGGRPNRRFLVTEAARSWRTRLPETAN